MKNRELRALYSVAETKLRLGIGKTKLYEMVKHKRLTPLKIDKRTLFAGSDITALIKTLQREAKKRAA